MEDSDATGPPGRYLPHPRPPAVQRSSSFPPASGPTAGSGPAVNRNAYSAMLPLSSRPFGHTERLPPFSHLLGHDSFANSLSLTQPTGLFSTSVWQQVPSPYYHGFPGRELSPRIEATPRENPSRLPLYHAPRPAMESLSSHSPLSNGYMPPRTSDASDAEARTHLSVSSSGLTHPDLHSPHAESPARQVLRDEDLPGRTGRYFSNDASLPPRATDEAASSPHFGTTKAGKPRKRKAQACTACRDKKVKCITDHPDRCNHCRKNDRECRFEPYSRNAHRSPSLSSTRSGAMDHPSYRPPSSASRISFASDAAVNDPHLPRSHSKASLDMESSQSPYVPASHSRPAVLDPERAALHSQQQGPESERSIDASRRAAGRKRPHPESPPIMADSSVRAVARTGEPSPSWENDPYDVDPRMTEHFLNEYFTRVNATTYCIFPRLAFLKWVRACRNKSQWDIMLLYAMLAYGCLLSSTAQHRHDGDAFSQIAHQAVERSGAVLNLQVVQTRLILALLNSAMGKINNAWEFCASALRTACELRLNTEEGVMDIQPSHGSDFWFHCATLIECRRRTFWSAYIMDRLNDFCSGHLSSFSTADALLRLPCDETRFEVGHVPSTPFFRNVSEDSLLTDDPLEDTLGEMAHLVQLSAIWGEVMTHAYRSKYHPLSEYGEAAEKFYKGMSEQLQLWGQVCLATPSEHNDQAQQVEAYSALHVLYHCTQMKLNRHIRHESMTPTQIQRNIRIAYNHACVTLRMMTTLMQTPRTTEEHPKLGFAISSPFTAFTILTAIDILTARGLVSDLLKPDGPWLSLLTVGIEALEDLSRHWDSTKHHLSLARDRLRDLSAAVQSHQATIGNVMPTAFFATEALDDSTLGLEHDLVYALPASQYLDALEMGRHDEHGGAMLEIQKEIKKGESW